MPLPQVNLSVSPLCFLEKESTLQRGIDFSGTQRMCSGGGLRQDLYCLPWTEGLECCISSVFWMQTHLLFLRICSALGHIPFILLKWCKESFAGQKWSGKHRPHPKHLPLLPASLSKPTKKPRLHARGLQRRSYTLPVDNLIHLNLLVK